MTISRAEKRQHLHEIHRRAQAGDLPLPEAVRFIREGFGMSQKLFAEKFGVKQSQLEALENGAANEALEALTKISQPFGFKISYVRQDP